MNESKLCPQCFSNYDDRPIVAKLRYSIRCRYGCMRIHSESDQVPTQEQINDIARQSPIGCRVDRWFVFDGEEMIVSYNYVRTWETVVSRSDFEDAPRGSFERMLRDNAAREHGRNRAPVYVVGDADFVTRTAQELKLVPFFDDCSLRIWDPWWSYRGKSRDYLLVVRDSIFCAQQLRFFSCFSSVSFDGGDTGYVIAGGSDRPGIVRMCSGAACTMVFEVPSLEADKVEDL